MPIINDEEFGTITVRRSARARNVRIRVAPNGQLRASLPLYAPMLLIRRLLKNSRPKIRKMLTEHSQDTTYREGMQIGKSHVLVIKHSPGTLFSVDTHGQQIIVTLPEGRAIEEKSIQTKIREAVISALRREAKSYLPRRLKYIAQTYHYRYDNVRFSHASSRWGSCSSSGTISLNIALMKLPFELIDYVLVHELAHTLQMNHSAEFWQLVKEGDPNYANHRNELKNYTTSI